jgi:hypothetical protein
METLLEFNKKRKRGLRILYINEILSLIAIYFVWNEFDWIFYVTLAYLIFSTLLLIKRIFKTKPKENDSYIFGETIGNKMNKTPQKFIFEVMLMSLSFIIAMDLFGTTYTLFWTDISLIYKIITGVSGYFGGAFMLMILISTFQQYKQFIQSQQIMNQWTLQKHTSDVMNEVMKGGK